MKERIIMIKTNKRNNILTPLYSNKGLRHNGFTLAETLITLVIVGVVAALTVPTIITKYQKEQTVTRLKKAYSALAQTTNHAIADNGPMTTWNVESDELSEPEVFFQRYLKPYLSVQKDCGIKTSDECEFKYKFLNSNTENTLENTDVRFYLNDGTFIALDITNKTPEENLLISRIFIDINGQKKPNKLGRDIFVFYYWIKYYNSKAIQGKFTSYGGYTTRTRDVLKTCSTCSSNYGCNKEGRGELCSGLIMYDNWQIKDDYPW